MADTTLDDFVNGGCEFMAGAIVLIIGIILSFTEGWVWLGISLLIAGVALMVIGGRTFSRSLGGID